ncbi:MAG: DUF4956 domain-containing protein [Oscillospiraceae bacterium]|nr:DUF4956 domain-containing protein [Oscillospiraceae bacterium]
MFDSILSAQMTLPAFLICLAVAIVLGLGTALVFTAADRHSAAFTQALALLPAVVTMVIMLVNGNIGAGLAVAGTFALVRFRSAPGSAKEIGGLFFAVAIGLACGMGYVGYAVVFFVVLAVMVLLMSRFHFGERGQRERQLKITIPENLDYDGLFDDLFRQYTDRWELTRVRTTNMGTLYELTYSIRLKDAMVSKDFIDAIRCRNGNLNIICGKEAERDIM